MTSIEETKLVTATDLMELPDDGYRYELSRGCLVRDQASGFEHSRIVMRLGYCLETWSRKAGTGYVTPEGGYKLQKDPDTVRVPDLAFVSHERLVNGRPTGFVEGAPDLAVEVVSPNDRWSAVIDEVSDYFNAGVVQVWVVVPTNRTVMIHRSPQDVTVLNEADILIGDGPLAGLELPVADIFE